MQITTKQRRTHQCVGAMSLRILQFAVKKKGPFMTSPPSPGIAAGPPEDVHLAFTGLRGTRGRSRRDSAKTRERPGRGAGRGAGRGTGLCASLPLRPEVVTSSALQPSLHPAARAPGPAAPSSSVTLHRTPRPLGRVPEWSVRSDACESEWRPFQLEPKEGRE